MGSPLSILIVEDSPEDALLIVRELQRGGFDPKFEVVASATAMRRALAEGHWEAIISDHALPGFDSFGALAIYKERNIDIPFIIVSGSIDQDTAVTSMRSGAHDYILKDNLSRLVPAMRRELAEANGREMRRIVERELVTVKEELAHQLSDMTVLHQLSVRLSSAQELNKVLDEILAAVTSLQATEMGALLLFETQAQPLRLAATRMSTPRESPWNTEVPLSGISAKALLERRMLHALIEEDVAGAVLGRAAFQEGYHSVVSIPLLTRGGALLGCVETYSRQSTAPSAREARLIELYMQQAGHVLDNVLLYEQAQEASRLKDEFVAMVSHELRTPLTPIMGAVHMLRSTSADPALVRRATDMIERNVRTQLQIIEDLLDISRIVSGKLRLRLSHVDLSAVVDAAVSTIRPAAEAKQIQLEANLQPVPGVLLGDSDRVQQIVWNLLSNAVKFTPALGKIQIEVRSNDGEAEISVSDTGIGIPREFLPHVFDRFRQADSSSTRSHGGLGLGLSIVRQLVELHGGTVMAESGGKGQGASFFVRLPLRHVDRQKAC